MSDIAASGQQRLHRNLQAYITGESLHEALWRGGRSYVQDVPLNATNTDIDWAVVPAWSHCCTATGPEAQGSYVLTHP